jgi:hypothetical protein
MAGLAVNAFVHPGMLQVRNIGMAGLAGRLSCKMNRPICNFRDRRTAIVTVLTKALRHHEVPHHEEHNDRNPEQDCKPKEVT